MNLARYGSIAMAAALSWPTLARAQSPDRETCARAHLSGQELRQATEPLAARDQFFVCASETCPAIIQQDCGRWLEEVQAGLPTVVLGARTASGQDIVDARVTANGREIAKRLDGKPVALDPGQQTFVFTIAGHGEIRVDALVKAGAKNREIIAELPPSDKADGAPSGSEPPLAFWVLAGVGTAGLASFGIFAALGESEYQDLDSSCAPRCSTADTDSVDTKFLVADISLGVALVAYAGAAYFYFTPSRRESVATRVRPSAPRLIVAPTASGGFIGLRGAL